MAADLTPDNEPTLNRGALERVLARAAELHNVDTGDSTDAISETRLMEIAREVGLSTTSIRQALAEERTRVTVDEERGWLARMMGPGSVSATRTVRGNPTQIMASLDIWMQREECLQVQRQFPDRMVWHARTDLVSTLKRSLKIGGRSYHLWRTHQVAGTVVALDESHVMIRLDADVAPRRAARAWSSVATGATGVALGGTACIVGVVAHVALLGVVAVAAVPVGISVGVASVVMKWHLAFVLQTKVALEQVLDRMEYTNGRKPASLLDALAGTRPLLG